MPRYQFDLLASMNIAATFGNKDALELHHARYRWRKKSGETGTGEKTLQEVIAALREAGDLHPDFRGEQGQAFLYIFYRAGFWLFQQGSGLVQYDMVEIMGRAAHDGYGDAEKKKLQKTKDMLTKELIPWTGPYMTGEEGRRLIYDAYLCGYWLQLQHEQGPDWERELCPGTFAPPKDRTASIATGVVAVGCPFCYASVEATAPSYTPKHFRGKPGESVGRLPGYPLTEAERHA